MSPWTNDGSDAQGIAVDRASAAYVTGTYFTSRCAHTDHPIDGADDTFAAKLDRRGAAYVYRFSGAAFDPRCEGEISTDDAGQGIALDPSGAAYVVGYTDDGEQAFVGRIDPAGRHVAVLATIGP